jgi:hypothetical protein
MPPAIVTETQIIEELRQLESTRWFEVRDFIGYLKHCVVLEREQAHTHELTASELLRSDLVGLWADRQDIGDSLTYARQLRQQAERRQVIHDAAA